MSSRKYAEYQNLYEKQNIRVFKIKANRQTESDLVDWLDSQENIQGYLKKLVMEDMRKQTAGDNDNGDK